MIYYWCKDWVITVVQHKRYDCSHSFLFSFFVRYFVRSSVHRVHILLSARINITICTVIALQNYFSLKWLTSMYWWIKEGLFCYICQIVSKHLCKDFRHHFLLLLHFLLAQIYEAIWMAKSKHSLFAAMATLMLLPIQQISLWRHENAKINS